VHASHFFAIRFSLILNTKALKTFPIRYSRTFGSKEFEGGRVIFMEMESVKLSEIVLRWYPEMMPFLKQNELDILIMLRDGLRILEPHDAMEIIQFSICEHQNSANLH
jgi:hypothetical protein